MKRVLYTGMRRGELFLLKWQDIDNARNLNGGVDQNIPLNDSARAIFEGHEKTGSPFVFPRKGGGQRKDIKKQVKRIKLYGLRMVEPVIYHP